MASPAVAMRRPSPTVLASAPRRPPRRHVRTRSRRSRGARRPKLFRPVSARSDLVSRPDFCALMAEFCASIVECQILVGRSS